MTTFYQPQPHSHFTLPQTPPYSSICEQASIVNLSNRFGLEGKYEEEGDFITYPLAETSRQSIPSCTTHNPHHPSLDITPTRILQRPNQPHVVLDQMGAHVQTSPLDGSVVPSQSIDMNMATKGTDSSKAGIETPLATYTAQMVVWLWFESSPPSSSPRTPPSITSSPTHQDPFDTNRPRSTPLNHLQFHASPEFTKFVNDLLRITNVSHSVVLIALLYIYRLKSRHFIVAGPGSERRPFIASLILANKYLDDNTYTNKTWADLTSLSVAEISKMESEFLSGLGYCLGVEKEDYLQWRKLLDGFIFSRQLNNRRCQPAVSYVGDYQTGLPPSYPVETSAYRARSASPPFSPPHDHYNPRAYASPRKRTAIDAFSNEMVRPGSVYESLRLPSRKAAFNGLPATMHPDQLMGYEGVELFTPQVKQEDSKSSLQRSTSLKRHIARLPDNSRRGSMSHIYGHEQDLRHAAANHQMELSFGRRSFELTSDYAGHSSLIAPYGPERAHVVPPDHLLFWSLAAKPHAGPDGFPRKGVLCYQNPGQIMPDASAYQPHASHYGYVPQAQYAPNGYDISMDADMSPTYAPSYAGYNVSPTQFPNPADYAPPPAYEGYARAEPAQFANAGPPGYAYDPHSQQWTMGSEEMLPPIQAPMMFNQTRPSQSSGPYSAVEQDAWRTKSEWNSPMPGYETWRR